MTPTSILVVAGEVSGDIHAANLLASLSLLRGGVQAFGIGGEELAAAGLECLFGTHELAHMGVTEVVRELPRIRRIMGAMVRAAERRRPALAVLVDSPDFNLRLAKRLRSLGIPVLLYVSPQLWAWRRRRVRVVRRVAQEVICILPFEVPFYQAAGVRARFVGHPLVDDVAKEGIAFGENGAESRRIALLPGSRVMEVRQLLPTMLRALRMLPWSTVDEAVLVEAPGVGAVIDEVLRRGVADERLRRVTGAERRRELATCGLAWTASGTATLECALLGVPMIVGYRLQPITYSLARLLVRVPHVALVNLIAERRISPELIQRMWNPSELARVSTASLSGGSNVQRQQLREVRLRLGPVGASERAAQAVVEYLDRNA